MPSWIDFGANLASTWHPKSNQNRSKSHQKSIQNLILFLMPSWTDFGRIFGATWTPKPRRNPLKNQLERFPTTKHRRIQNPLKTSILFDSRYVVLGLEIIKNRTDVLQKVASTTMLQFGSILNQTWLNFGRVLAPKLVPIWPQVALNVDPEKYDKTDHILERF